MFCEFNVRVRERLYSFLMFFSGVTDFRSVNGDVSLAELGVDSLMGVEVTPSSASLRSYLPNERRPQHDVRFNRQYGQGET